MKKLIAAILTAVALWAVMFSPVTAPHINFWWAMTLSALVLSTFAFLFNTQGWKDVRLDAGNLLLGVCIAVALWAVFWVGDKAAAWLLPFARPQVDLIYGMKAGESPWLLSLRLLFIIGPAEELFWRGYVQRTLSVRWNANKGLVVTTLIYTLVHISSLNFMLIAAAAVAGLTWGLLYRFLPHRFAAIVLSHALWDVAVFVWFPI